ncbi:MAG: radical SAM family heme chaperone HemW [Desulfobacterales bacterium]
MTPPPTPAAAAGLYIHVPFCRKKCRYCDFYSVENFGLQVGYLKALRQEMRLAAAAHPALGFDTLYLGGGTPTVLGAGGVEEIIAAARQAFSLLADTEVTVEVNPGTIDRDSLKRLRQAGVNRLNIGIQSFTDRHLAFLGRIHSAADAGRALAWAHAAGFDNIGIDLIYGLPGQTPADWRLDLLQALDGDLAHLSCYSLTYEAGTPLEMALKSGKFAPAGEDRVAGMYLQALDILAQGGLAQYETANFARSRAHHSRHNLKYWSFLPYLGLGPSAHSFMAPERFWNHADIDLYIRKLGQGRRPIAESERLTREKSMIEAVYLGLRLTDGIDLSAFQERFKTGFMELFGERAAVFDQKGWLTTTAGRCRLTPRGMLLLDAIAAAFIEHIS